MWRGGKLDALKPLFLRHLWYFLFYWALNCGSCIHLWMVLSFINNFCWVHYWEVRDGRSVLSSSIHLSYTGCVLCSTLLKYLKVSKCIAHGICLTIKIISYLSSSLLLALLEELGAGVEMTHRQQYQHKGKTVEIILQQRQPFLVAEALYFCACFLQVKWNKEGKEAANCFVSGFLGCLLPVWQLALPKRVCKCCATAL